MRHPAIDNLLILQNRDTKRIQLETEIKSVPDLVRAVEEKILADKKAIEDARTELMDLETQKKLIETEIGTMQGTLGKYKTQQSLVRKNDEYQALGQQIASTEAAIGGLEEKELGVMFEIDGAKVKFADAEKVLKDNIAGHESRIATLREREKNLAVELAAAQAEVAKAREPLDALSLRLYDRIAERTQPVVAAVHGGNCDGCHLKVSGESESNARKGEVLATCDQCGRIIWWD
ncbi:putative nucleic acid-binding Zn-ribbon protein [Ereboglobus sp. PH5-5]|uniref:zinc ribbon domain-containing protein n=1 Tax=unclassified Ereboglobus TaxID=2626932 RepID=UPI0024070233|nr:MULTISPECIES: C4-type zinc ribbon domain-containing protein [unclassified Ereboglobus]MDF9828217.1 putative nucleic acid-binding Zn-ribbon protein [Ereboglobus sp. PH5-10]MDF9832416.1 putative nucleic acid-binding Zn-ribbon protein [Ereboglobus sp. PH5-5]